MRAGKGMGGRGGGREMGKHIAVKSGKKCLHLWMIQAIKSGDQEMGVKGTGDKEARYVEKETLIYNKMI